MSEVEFVIKGQPGTISASTFQKTVAGAMDLLGEYDSAISGIARQLELVPFLLGRYQ